MATSLRVLILEDNPTDAELVVRELRRAGFEPSAKRVETRDEYLTRLDASVDIIFADYRLPQFRAEEALDLLQQTGLDIPFVIISGAMGEDVAVRMIKAGATDYLLKDRLARIGSAVTNALKDRRLRAENRKALQALQENEARYRSLVQAMSQTVWIANPDGETISGSVNWRQFTGQTWEEAKAWGWLNALHADDREKVQQCWRDAIAGKKVYEAEYRVRAVDGTYGYFLARGVPVLRDDGSVYEWVGTCINISQQKQAELRNAAFSTLGRHLSAVSKPEEAAKIIVEVAHKLFGWDACTLDLYSPEQNAVLPLINIDTIDGERRDITPSYVGRPPTTRMQQVVSHGKLLILRDESFSRDASTVPFGDTQRLSASIMMVPVRNGTKIIGLLSIQSYSHRAYDDEDLETLQVLADYCGGALERIRTEESLREKEERFRQMAENIRELFWLAAPDAAGLIYVSPAYETIWGRTLESLWKNPHSSLEAVLPEDRPIIEGYLQRYKTEACEVEYRISRPDGTIRYIRDRAFPIRDAAGKVCRVAGIAEDITERRHSRLRTAAFSTLGERLNSATKPEEAAQIIVDVADKLFGWDSCFLSLYSAKTNTIRSLLNIDIIDGQKRPVSSTLRSTPSQRMREIIDKGAQLILREHFDQPVSGIVPFGSGKLSASIMTVPVRKGSEVIGVLSIQSYKLKAYNRQDLETLQALADYCGGALERIRAEERMQYQANLLANVNDAIIATDAEDILTSWNHAAEEMYGWKAEEAIGRKLGEIVPAELTDVQRQEIEQSLAQTGRCHIAAKHRRRTGESIDVEGTTITLRNEAGKITGYASVHRNVTKRRQLEEQLRQSQKMEAFGQLAGGVAHDFNNLLTVIGGYTNLLLCRDDLHQDVREELSLIAGATEKAGNLTRQLLTFSRKKEMQLASIRINDIVSNLTKMLQRVIGEEVKLQLVYAPALPEIQADASMMEQVLLNLAINARDAMVPRGGELFISTCGIKVTESYGNPEARPGDFVCLTVRDTGCGMPPEIQERIFEPFFTTKGGKGTGLGLATVYGIVKQHKGWIEVSSEVGVGTTFKVFFPAVPVVAAPSVARVIEPDVRGGTETILLVEDEIGVRGLARQILQRHGYRVIEAETAVKALSIWPEHQNDIQLVVTDMVMPGGMNGHELALKLNAEKPGLKVIYVSGYSVNLNELQLREGWNFLQKPYQPKKLAKAIRDRLDEGRHGNGNGNGKH